MASIVDSTTLQGFDAIQQAGVGPHYLYSPKHDKVSIAHKLRLLTKSKDDPNSCAWLFVGSTHAFTDGIVAANYLYIGPVDVPSVRMKSV